MELNEKRLRAIHAVGCEAVTRADRSLSPDVDAFWPTYLSAVLMETNGVRLLAAEASNDHRTALINAIDVLEKLGYEGTVSDLRDLLVHKATLAAMHEGANIVPITNTHHLSLAEQDIREERRRQDDQWGGPAHDDEHSATDFARYIERQLSRVFVAEAVATNQVVTASAHDVRNRFVKAAALAVAAIESIDRKQRGTA